MARFTNPVSGGSADIADFVFTNEGEGESSTITISNKDFSIQTLRDDEDNDADINLDSADDIFITANGDDVVIFAQDEVRIEANDNIELSSGDVVALSGTNGEFIGVVGVAENQIATIGDISSIQYSQTLIVDPNGVDATASGGPNNPFQTIQAAHDYAEENIDSAKQVVVKINAGQYTENITVTRTRTSFVGLSQGISKSTRINGQITISTSASVGGAGDDVISFENLSISSNSNVIALFGSFAHTTFFKDLQIITSASDSKCLEVVNNSAGGNRVYITNCTFSNKESSETTIDFSNTFYANIDGMIVLNGTGKAMNITTTDAVIANARFESDNGATTMIGANSSFNVGRPALSLANSWVVNPSVNGDGIEIASGAIVNVGQVAFSVGTAAGTGFAVKGVSGAVFVNGNNLIVPGTNSKISTAITRVPFGTSLTPA